MKIHPDRFCKMCSIKISVSRLGKDCCSKKCETDEIRAELEYQETIKRIGLNGTHSKELADRPLKMLLIGDSHFPFGHPGVFEAIFKRIQQWKPQVVIQMGDLYDFYSWTRFPKSLNIMTPRQELEFGREDAEIMWSTIEGISSAIKKIQIKGNHDLRPIKRLMENAPDLEDLYRGYETFTFPNVETIHDERALSIIGGVNITHGHRKHGTHALEVMMNTAVAHTHKGGMVMHSFGQKKFWELNVGFTADTNQKPLQYMPKKYDTCTLGWGEIDEYGPRFCPWSKK